MSDALFGAFLNFLIFAAIGAGPCLWLLSGRRRVALATALAPAAGFALTTVFGSYFTLCEVPVSCWTLPWVAAALSVSGALAASCPAARKRFFRPGRKRWIYGALAGLLLTAVLSAAPYSLGGLRFYILRGNGTDSFNYITVAGYMDREPFSWFKRVDAQTLVNRDQSYERVPHFLKRERWSTYMMLAYESRVAGVPIYRFEYLFSVLCFLMMYGPALLYARVLLKLRPIHALLTAMALCAGFWAQFVLDLRSDSQQHSLPLLLSMALLTAHLRDRRDRCRRGTYILLGVLAVALLFAYPEIAPLVLCAGVIFFTVCLIRDRRLDWTGYAWTAGVAVAGAWPLLNVLLPFLFSQARAARELHNTWHTAYFKWLYADPLTGIWGFGPLTTRPTLHALFLAAGLVLSLTLIAALIWSLRPASRAGAGMVLASALALAALLQWGYLASRGQYWAAGKGLSFGYPYLLLAMLGFALSCARRLTKHLRRLTASVAVPCAAFFLLVQAGLACYRPWFASMDGDYVNYISSHGEYKQHDWDLSGIEHVLQGHRAATVCLDVPSPWLAEYVRFVLGENAHVVNVGTPRQVDEVPPTRPDVFQPRYAIVSRSGQTANSGAARVLARTAEAALIEWPRNTPLLLSVQNPNGIEGAPAEPFYWLGGAPTVFTLLASRDTTLVFRARFLLGPSRPGLAHRTLLITSNASPETRRVVLTEGNREFRVPAVAGINQVKVEIEEKPTFYLPNDRRPLLMRVDFLKLEDDACS